MGIARFPLSRFREGVSIYITDFLATFRPQRLRRILGGLLGGIARGDPLCRPFLRPRAGVLGPFSLLVGKRHIREREKMTEKDERKGKVERC